ncbi:DnaD domain protein [Desnuesiella massiliensis]|uniref:DnaD domain-containing protein n=1 Tax=Desnuesiella massiliensis TaxID=1650662 RepID=UPI0006E3E61A|nr:DnaD domain protein [Desnuesiella massiliensis]
MAKYRQIQTCFWKDSFVTELTPEEKFFYMYIMTNSNTTQCGIYTFIIKFAEVETGYNSDTIEKLLKKFVEYGKISYCKETKELMVLNWVKYNFVNNKAVISCMNKELQQIKHKPFIKALYNICLKNALPVEQIFKGIALDELGAEDFNFEESLGPIGPSDKSKLRPIGHSGETKLWPGEEEEEKEEKEIEEEVEEYTEAAKADLKVKGKLSEAIDAFNNNNHPMTPMEYEKILDWAEDVEPGVIILAIEEAVKHNARNFVYIERLLNN